jgi:hypothetical protein
MPVRAESFSQVAGFQFPATNQKESRRCREERHAMEFAHITLRNQHPETSSSLFLLLHKLYFVVYNPILCFSLLGINCRKKKKMVRLLFSLFLFLTG